jgi:hypothetical protein
LIDKSLDSIVVTDRLLTGVLNVDSRLCLSNFELKLSVLGINKQILKSVHIDFYHHNSNLEFDVLVRVVSNSIENFDTGLRDDTLVSSISENRVRFTSSSLPVSKNSGVLTLPGVIKKCNSEFVPNPFLILVFFTVRVIVAILIFVVLVE